MNSTGKPLHSLVALCAVALFAVAPLAAVTVGPDWCVAYPESGSKDVNRVLRIAAEEVRDDLNAATGLKLKAVPASKAKAPAIWIGAEFAKSAGFDLSDMKWYDNAIAEKGKGRKGEIDMLWSPNLESRSMVAPNAMGKLVFK